MNNVILTGRTTKEIEIKITNSGKKVTQFTLAVKKDKDNAYFINCVAWEKNAELLSNFVRKGNRVGVVGKLTTRDYEEQSGRKVYVTEVLVDSIELLESKSDTTQPAPQVQQPQYQQQDYTFTLDDVSF